MPRLLPISRTIPATLFAVWLVLAGAQACSICGTPSIGGLMLDHPKALAIAIATSTAAEKGILSKQAPTSDNPATPGPQNMPGWMLQRRLLPGYPAGTSAELLLIDKGSRRLLRKPGEAARPATVRIVTTTRALHAIMSNDLTASAATAAGLMLVEPLPPTLGIIPNSTHF